MCGSGAREDKQPTMVRTVGIEARSPAARGKELKSGIHIGKFRGQANVKLEAAVLIRRPRGAHYHGTQMIHLRLIRAH